ncbi:hypothetical protein CYMTET_53624 [Cymbomonas tetramitiformis]|uniref:Uncharacterized protein n=1 Tax=Cymbomonas tetramitiformis TaxID=36881 RepID=A0AAE0BHZ2_9CHLO|nr:hypothetical protein CYMTET_53624 [Cymbomonas tetramitiformis]
MIGSWHKNVVRLVDKVVRNKTVSDKVIKAGVDTYLLYGSSQLKGRIELTRFNLFGKAGIFRRFRMQRKLASFHNTLKRMVRTGKYAFATNFISDGRGLSEES